MIHGRKDAKILELTSENTYVLIVEKLKKKKRKNIKAMMEDVKKQLEIAFLEDTSKFSN